MTGTSERLLYERLGGYEAIVAVTDEFLGRVQGNPALVGYWTGHSEGTMRKERQLIVDFMCEAAGGPVFYTGRDMETSHLGLGITASEYDILMVHCVATLEQFEVPEREKNEVCGFLNGLRDEIVVRD